MGLAEGYYKGGLKLGNIDKKVRGFRIKWLSTLLEGNKNSIEFFLANDLVSKNDLKIGLNILKGYEINHLKSIKNKFYKNACLFWKSSNITFIPKNRNSIKDLWLYDNILLKNDDGRVFKPPRYFTVSRGQHDMPKTFGDLPYIIMNRNEEDSRKIRSINKSFSELMYSSCDAFFIKINGTDTLIKQLSLKEIYWSQFNTDNNNDLFPWRRKWNNILRVDEFEWEYVWQNVHDNFLPYSVQSSLWEILNMNYISSYKLNLMYNIPKRCLNCQIDEEGSVHAIVFCEVNCQV